MDRSAHAASSWHWSRHGTVKELVSFGYLARALIYERSDQASLERRRDVWVRRLIRHAYDQVPYYRTLLRRASIHPDEIQGVRDLHKIPVSTKQDLLSAGLDQVLARNYTGARLLHSSTSGSSGLIFDAWSSPAYGCLRKAFGVRHLFSFGNGGRLTDRILRFGWTTRRPEDERMRLLPFRTMMSYEDPDRMIAAINAYRPTILHGYPSVLRLIAQHAVERGAPLWRPRLVFAAGELLDDGTRQVVERAFGSPPRNLYGTTELGYMAVECAKRQGMHVYEDNVVLEIVDTDRVVPPQAPGDIVATTLHGYAMPFIRYQVGDAGCLDTRRCACGISSARLVIAEGRSDDMVRLRDGRQLAPRVILRYFNENVPGLREFQVTQLAYEQFVVKAVVGPDFTHEGMRNLKANIANEVPGAHVQVGIVPSIERGRTGKHKAFVQMIPTNGCSQEARSA